ncbi:MAG: phenylalanine--tRNA ligase subunit alpha [Clostridiales bacterium]|jgi:phenylalanyl-tRNA synthetase alpha chain|nr:phenylalanine--tRNA ligase subunit alpha [Clostridiales bacterium]
MKDKLEAIKRSAAERVKETDSLTALEELRLSLLGKKGELTQILRGMGNLSPEERPAMGRLVNDTRAAVEEMLNNSKKHISDKEQNMRLAHEKLDVTMPGRTKPVGHLHPLSIVINELSELFIGMGYEVAEGPDVETDYYNFEALNIPANHPAKDEQDTFYVEGGLVLRTQTSSVQIRTMEKKKPPIKIIAPGTVFRSDQVDPTHSPVFHQLEGLVVDKGVTMAGLKGSLIMFVKKLFGNETKARFRPHHFPFTEPSAEMDISCFACGGKGCRVCKDSGWIEILGCGMVHPRVLEMGGIDPTIYSGFAFGMGLNRIAMQRYAITDMRLLFEGDTRFLQQF